MRRWMGALALLLVGCAEGRVVQGEPATDVTSEDLGCEVSQVCADCALQLSWSVEGVTEVGVMSFAEPAEEVACGDTLGQTEVAAQLLKPVDGIALELLLTEEEWAGVASEGAAVAVVLLAGGEAVASVVVEPAADSGVDVLEVE
jgi:hypothetical protein